jgi:putative ABC transport system ATP-binding protein
MDPDNGIVLDARGLTKRYKSGDRDLTVLNDVSFRLAAGAACAIVGPSGSGKTTLLGLCAGLDLPDAGAVSVGGVDLNSLSEEGRARLRREALGFVFQNFRLLPTLTALENVMVPLELQNASGARQRAADLLARVGLGARVDHFPAQLSGGEQQRVGLARAFIHRPQILFADEPTGNMDSETGEHITRLLFDINRTEGTALVLVTHNPELARRAGRILRLSGGKLVSDESQPAR